MSVEALEPCEHAGGGAGLSRSVLDGLLLQFVLNSGLSGHCLCDFVPHNCSKSKFQSTQAALHWLAAHHLDIELLFW